MGWLTLLVVVAGAFGAMVAFGLKRPLWSMAGAALMIGATGYSLQGRPDLPGQAARPGAAIEQEDAGLIALRDEMFGRLSAQGAYVIAADAMTRIGAKDSAAHAVLGGIRRYPQNVLLWTALGGALAAHDGNTLSPSALLAYRHAVDIAPEHPGPVFFFGLAYARQGDFAMTRRLWGRALALSPARAPYRAQIEGRVRLLDLYLSQRR